MTSLTRAEWIVGRYVPDPIWQGNNVNWGELIDSLVGDRKVVTLSTATTGLNLLDEDELIGVCIDDNTYFRSVPNDVLLKAQDYHKVTGEMLAAQAMDDTSFRDTLRNQLDNTIILTYNPEFQCTALFSWCDVETLPLVDLPRVYKGAAAQLAVEDGGMALDYLNRMAANVKGRLGFRSLCERLGIIEQDGVELPMQSASQQLWRLYGLLRGLPAIVQARVR